MPERSEIDGQMDRQMEIDIDIDKEKRSYYALIIYLSIVKYL